MSREPGSDKGIWKPEKGKELGATTNKHYPEDTYSGPGNEGYKKWQGKESLGSKSESIPTRLHRDNLPEMYDTQDGDESDE